jgi:hypothetical protein
LASTSFDVEGAVNGSKLVDPKAKPWGDVIQACLSEFSVSI